MSTRFLDASLAAVGYRRKKAGVYAFDIPADCAHLLAVQLLGKADRYLTAEFCFFNSDAEGFAVSELRKYGDPVFKSWKHDPALSVMRFSVGEVAGWAPGAALWQRQISDNDFARLFAETIKRQIVPLAKQVASTDDLLRVLLSNDPPYQWVKSNGAIRAAEIIFLSSRQGMSGADIRSLLESYAKEVEIGLGTRRELDAAKFIDAVIADASPSALH